MGLYISSSAGLLKLHNQEAPKPSALHDNNPNQEHIRLSRGRILRPVYLALTLNDPVVYLLYSDYHDAGAKRSYTDYNNLPALSAKHSIIPSTMCGYIMLEFVCPACGFVKRLMFTKYHCSYYWSLRSCANEDVERHYNINWFSHCMGSDHPYWGARRSRDVAAQWAGYMAEVTDADYVDFEQSPFVDPQRYR